MSKSIQVKQPELETKRVSLLQNESDLLKKREKLQEKLLLELSKSQGDILKNDVIAFHLQIYDFVPQNKMFYNHFICLEIVGNIE